jgi:hypothetical protein
LANEFHFHGWSRGSKLWKTWKGLKKCQKWDQKSFVTLVYIHFYLPQHTNVMKLMNDSISLGPRKFLVCLMLLLCVDCLLKSINWIFCIVEKDGAIFHQYQSFGSFLIFYCKFSLTREFIKTLTKIVHKMHKVVDKMCSSKAPRNGWWRKETF